MRLGMKPHGAAGLLITFCGLDGSGKTTMIRMLAEHLESIGQPALLTKQPTDLVRGSGIFRAFADRPENGAYEYRALSLLCASDRVQHCGRVILPALKEGRAVVSDRYFYSCVANLRARGYTEDRWVYEIAESIIRPDAAFFLDVSVETAVGRARGRPEEKGRYIDVPLQHRLRKEYLALAAENEGIVLDGSGPASSAFAKIKQAVERLLQTRGDGGRGRS